MIIVAFISSVLSVFAHAYLTAQHYQLKLGLAAGQSACNINSTFNCDSVAVSPYAVLWGVPIATWGAWTNLILALLILLAMINLLSNRERVLRYAGGFALFIALTSVSMGLISSMLLKTYCLYCMGTYVLSFITLGALIRETHFLNTKTIGADLKDLMGSHRWVLALVFAIPAGSALTQAIVSQQYGLGQMETVIQESLGNWKSAPNVTFNPTGSLSFQKENKPPIMTIVEFADFLCPHCRMAYPTLHSFAEGRSDVQLIFKPFPLDGTCNKDIPRKGDGNRCVLAAAVFCAEKIGQKGWRLHHWIFDNQEELFDTSHFEKTISAGVASLDLSWSEVKKCTDTDEIKDLVEHQAQEGASAKIQGTPSVFVNGKLLERGQFMPVLDAVYKDLTSSKL
jgi:protein-disulfide isomerase/uncharacterized membrane protein